MRPDIILALYSTDKQSLAHNTELVDRLMSERHHGRIFIQHMAQTGGRGIACRYSNLVSAHVSATYPDAMALGALTDFAQWIYPDSPPAESICLIAGHGSNSGDIGIVHLSKDVSASSRSTWANSSNRPSTDIKTVIELHEIGEFCNRINASLVVLESCNLATVELAFALRHKGRHLISSPVEPSIKASKHYTWITNLTQGDWSSSQHVERIFSSLKDSDHYLLINPDPASLEWLKVTFQGLSDVLTSDSQLSQHSRLKLKEAGAAMVASISAFTAAECLSDLPDGEQLLRTLSSIASRSPEQQYDLQLLTQEPMVGRVCFHSDSKWFQVISSLNRSRIHTKENLTMPSDKDKRRVLLHIYRNALETLVPDTSMGDTGEPIEHNKVRELHRLAHNLSRALNPTEANLKEIVDLMDDLSTPPKAFSTVYPTHAERWTVIRALGQVVTLDPARSAAPYAVPDKGWGY